MASIASFSGLASGIQWQDMIDQIMALESARRVDPLNAQISAQRLRADAWTSYQGWLTKLTDAAKGLRDGSAFGAFKVSAGAGSGGRALVAASASTSAAPGSYKVEVLGLAKAEKLSGDVVASTTTALGLSGEFAVNGRRVAVTATDTLASLRDKINAANTGSSPSRVSASILSTGSGAHRLVLTSDVAGSAGIDLTDGGGGVLAGLGLVDGVLAANATATGGTETRRVSSMTSAIAAALGVTMPPPSSIRVGDTVIAVDLAQDSLSAIAAKIEAAGVPARVVEEMVDGRASYRLQVEASVTADPLDAANSQRTLEVLGFLQPGRGAVQQVVGGEQAWLDGGAPAGGGSLLTGLEVGGAEAGIAEGDVITIRGTRGDGSAVLQTLTVGAASTVDDLLAQVNAAYAGARGATASLGPDGTIRLTDAQGGESQLSLSLTVSRGGTEAASLGRTTTEQTGRLREVVSGSDARLRVDGVTITRSGNTVSDVIAGVTLTLQGAEPGTEIDVSVARDDDAIVAAVQKFATAYNDVAAFVASQAKEGAPLAFNGTLRSTMSQLTNVLLTDLQGLPTGAAFNRATLAGVSLTKTGTLEVDTAKLKSALQTSFADVKALFGTGGTTTDAALEYVTAGAKAKPGSYEVVVTALAERPQLAGSGFGGVYAATGAGDKLRVTDSVSGRTVELALVDGATSSEIVAALDAKLKSEGLKAGAALAANGRDLVLTGTEYGSAATLTVAFLPADGASADPFGLAGSDAGADAAGTIGGRAATGFGQVLSAAAGTAEDPNPAEGVSVRYTGAATGSVGTVAFTRGVAGLMTQVTDLLTRGGDGTIAMQQDSIDSSITSLERRLTDAELRLEQRRESLTRQFAAMEAALSRIQAQGNWLTQQIQAMQPRQQ